MALAPPEVERNDLGQFISVWNFLAQEYFMSDSLGLDFLQHILGVLLIVILIFCYSL